MFTYKEQAKEIRVALYVREMIICIRAIVWKEKLYCSW